MSTFSVNLNALQGLPVALDRRWIDLRAGADYASRTTVLQFDGGQFDQVKPRHDLVIAAIVRFFDDAADNYASGYADRVAIAMETYRTTDGRAADRLLPSWASRVSPTTATAKPSAGQEIFADVVVPQDRLRAPGAHTGDMTYKPSWTDMFSPTSIVRDAVYYASKVGALLGMLPHPIDPFETLARPFIGDWPGLLRSAEAFDHLADELDGVGVDLRRNELATPEAWTGNAADSLRYCLRHFDFGIAEGAARLRLIAGAYRQVAAGMYRNSQVMASLITMFMDLPATIAEDETVIGAVLGVPTEIIDQIQVIQQMIPIAEDAARMVTHGIDDEFARRFGQLRVEAVMPDMTEPYPAAPAVARRDRALAVA